MVPEQIKSIRRTNLTATAAASVRTKPANTKKGMGDIKARRLTGVSDVGLCDRRPSFVHSRF